MTISPDFCVLFYYENRHFPVQMTLPGRSRVIFAPVLFENTFEIQIQEMQIPVLVPVSNRYEIGRDNCVVSSELGW